MATNASWIGILSLLTACAARTLPEEFPATSPASRKAPESAPLEVNVSLRSDPPLPGERDQAWPGLRERELESKDPPKESQPPSTETPKEHPHHAH